MAELARDELDLAYRVLDLDLVDCEKRRCGKVDDLVLEGDPGAATYVAAVLAGPSALARRFPRRLRWLSERLFSGGETRVEWSDVDEIEQRLTLERSATELGLGEGERALLEGMRRAFSP